MLSQQARVDDRRVGASRSTPVTRRSHRWRSMQQAHVPHQLAAPQVLPLGVISERGALWYSALRTPRYRVPQRARSGHACRRDSCELNLFVDAPLHVDMRELLGRCEMIHRWPNGSRRRPWRSP